MYSTAEVDEEKESEEVDIVVKTNTIVDPSVEREREMVSLC